MSSRPAVSKSLILKEARQARRLPRRRKTLALSPANAPVQKLVNIICENSYIRPHCHRPRKGKDGFELFTLLHGEVGILTFNTAGKIIAKTLLSSQGAVSFEVAENQFHTVLALSPVAAILEIKQGPYYPQSAKEFHQAFPEEFSSQVDRLVRHWRSSLK